MDKNKTFAEVRNEFLTLYLNKNFNDICFSDFCGKEKPLEELEEVLSNEVKKLYPNEYVSREYDRNKIRFYLSNGNYYEREEIFSIIVKRKVKDVTTHYGYTTTNYTFSDVSFSNVLPSETIQDLINKVTSKAKEKYDKDFNEVLQLQEKLSKFGITMEDVQDLNNDYYHLSSQGQEILNNMTK